MAARKKKHLVIVESPAKAKTINKYLGPDFEVAASKGHVRDLPKSRFGIDIEAGWVPTYRHLDDRKEVIATLKKQAAKADIVYLAPDPDREGEAIAWHLKEALGLDDERARRVTFNEITKRAVQEAFADSGHHRHGSRPGPGGPPFPGPGRRLQAQPAAVPQAGPAT